uniref:Uncharacterized protein n=1 Tax=Parastrongyloides trichosuri TaxID=131310 RepID=A0A0N4Z1G1_PARTI
MIYAKKPFRCYIKRYSFDICIHYCQTTRLKDGKCIQIGQSDMGICKCTRKEPRDEDFKKPIPEPTSSDLYLDKPYIEK